MPSLNNGVAHPLHAEDTVRTETDNILEVADITPPVPSSSTVYAVSAINPPPTYLDLYIHQVALQYERGIPNPKADDELEASLLEHGQLAEDVVSGREVDGLPVLLEGYRRISKLAAWNKPLRVRVATEITTPEQEREFLHNSGLGSPRSKDDQAANILLYMRENNASQKKAAKAFNMSEATLCRRLAQTKVAEPVTQALMDKRISNSQLFAFRATKDEDKQTQLLERVLQTKMPAEEIRQLLKPKPGKKPVKLRTLTAGGVTITYPETATTEQLQAAAKALATLMKLDTFIEAGITLSWLATMPSDQLQDATKTLVAKLVQQLRAASKSNVAASILLSDQEEKTATQPNSKAGE